MKRLVDCGVLVLAAACLSACSTTMELEETATDRDLVNAVYERLQADTVTRQQTYNITARDGVVTIKGLVPSPNFRARVLSIAENTDRVVRVVDGLRVVDAAAGGVGEGFGDAAFGGRSGFSPPGLE